MATILLVTEVLSVSTGAREALTLKESPLTDLSTTTGYSNAKQNRVLRVAQTPDQDDRAVDEDAKSEPNETEERAGGVSSIVSKISDKIPMKLKMAWWRDFKKPASYVKKKMGLEGLSGAELTSHKNYKLFLKYKATIEKDWLVGYGLRASQR
uniref:RxLR effector protein n=1 Tax=Phytophthora sojae TaxID=67593 RepID=E0W534_PHYSO|nr:Avh266a1 [Phytophthora sojae]AEK81076.1 Avh266a1 [Phytophthora sojae]